MAIYDGYRDLEVQRAVWEAQQRVDRLYGDYQLALGEAGTAQHDAARLAAWYEQSLAAIQSDLDTSAAQIAEIWDAKSAEYDATGQDLQARWAAANPAGAHGSGPSSIRDFGAEDEPTQPEISSSWIDRIAAWFA